VRIVQVCVLYSRFYGKHKTNLAKHYRARVFEKKGGGPYERLRLLYTTATAAAA